MFTHGLKKAIKVFNQVLSRMSCTKKLKFSWTILQVYKWLKCQGINHSSLKKLLKWHVLHATDTPVSAIICRLGFHASLV